MLFSGSPGETPLTQAEHVSRHLNMWRISDDFWDDWGLLLPQFKRLRNWAKFAGPGHWPDADMLPLGRIHMGERDTRFTRDEQITLMTLWCIARSPLMMGGDLTKLDDWTLSLLTNEEVLAVNQHSTGNRELFNRDGLIAWTADVPDSPDQYLAVFNTTDIAAYVPVEYSGKLRYLWRRKDVPAIEKVPPHGAGLYRVRK